MGGVCGFAGTLVPQVIPAGSQCDAPTISWERPGDHLRVALGSQPTPLGYHGPQDALWKQIPICKSKQEVVSAIWKFFRVTCMRHSEVLRGQWNCDPPHFSLQPTSESQPTILETLV